MARALYQSGFGSCPIPQRLHSQLHRKRYCHERRHHQKKEFHTVLGMLAARTGNILNHSSLAKDSGVKSVTINEWISVLERTALIYLLPPLEANLNKRLTKSPKVYFLDTGLATRLQGWMDHYPLLTSPQAGALFETLVLSEIVKCLMNFGKNWKVLSGEQKMEKRWISSSKIAKERCWRWTRS